MASGSAFWAKVSSIEKFESAHNFVTSGSVIGEKISLLVEEFESALIFMASGSVFWAKASIVTKYESALIFWQVGQFLEQKGKTLEEFEKALIFVVSGSIFGAKASIVIEYESALIFVASESVFGATYTLKPIS